jgi:spectinomycin phosphotransferase
VKIAPASPTDSDVLEVVQREWNEEASEAVYLPVGFGAHHWRISAGGAPVLFCTLDQETGHRSLDDLERAYASVAALVAAGFRGGVAPIQSHSGTFTVPVAGGTLSATIWLEGRNPTLVEAREQAHVARLTRLLTQLHASEPPEGIPVWQPRVDRDFLSSLWNRTQTLWDSGPYGEVARTEILASIEMIADSLREYYVLAELALANRNYWVVTHGEPHWANQFIVCDELFLVNWDTIALAPPEFDAVDLPLSARVAMVCDEQMLRMFRLERQLTEITEYAEWFESNHTGTEDDRDALDRLRKELRPV